MRRSRDELVSLEPPAVRHRVRIVSEWQRLGWGAQMLLIAHEWAYIGPNGVVWYNFSDMQSFGIRTMIHRMMPANIFRWTTHDGQPWIGWHVEDEVWWYTYGTRDLGLIRHLRALEEE